MGQTKSKGRIPMPNIHGVFLAVLCLSLILAGCGGGAGGGGITPTNDPQAVTLSDTAGITNSSMELSWPQSAESDFASYKVYWSPSSGVSQSSPLADTITSKATTTKTVAGLSSGRTYFYKVYVCDTGSLCTGSNEVSGTTAGAGNPSGNEWLTIPAGDFIMGCASGDTQCYSDESPRHTVFLPAYKMLKYLVTNAQYAACVGAAVCTAPSRLDSDTHTSYYGDAAYNNYPVIYVDWNRAKAYCTWLGGRLPTEAEWEKVARGPSPSEVIYPWGNGAPTCSLVNGRVNYVFCASDTTAVDSYPSGSSYYGAMDMAGNVWEWVNDWYVSNYYSSSPSADPQGPVSGTYRVLRGVSWDDGRVGDGDIRVSLRNGDYPSESEDELGFRCAQD